MKMGKIMLVNELWPSKYYAEVVKKSELKDIAKFI